MRGIEMLGYNAMIRPTGNHQGVLMALGPKARKDIEIGSEVQFYWPNHFDVDGERCVVVPDINMAKV